jgi:4-carboxymuconolactone decarboxylase
MTDEHGIPNVPDETFPSKIRDLAEQSGSKIRDLGEPFGSKIRDLGDSVRRRVLGDAHVDAALAGANEFTADFQDFITAYAWGGIWGRDGLDLRTRSAITLAMLATLQADGELAMHVAAARRNGLTVDEIKEVLLHVGIYAGLPAANAAFAVARRVLDQETR